MDTNPEKLDRVIATLTILLPRLTGPFRRDVDFCIKDIKAVKKDMEDGLYYERGNHDSP